MKRIAHINGTTITNVSLASDDAPLQPGTMLESEALSAGYLYQSITDVKKWASVAEFWAEFTTTEQAAISTSTDQTVSLIRTNLAMWRGAVNADHPQITQGIAYLTGIGLITPARASEILG